MSDSEVNFSFPIPKFARRAFTSLLLPNETLDEVFDQVGGIHFEESNYKTDKSVWGSKQIKLEKRSPEILKTFCDTIAGDIESDIEESDIDSDIDNNTLEDINNKIEKTNMKTIKSEPSHFLSENDSLESGNNSPTYSEDLFAEAGALDKKSNTNKQLTPESSSSDEEIIPCSQTVERDNDVSSIPLSTFINRTNSQKSGLDEINCHNTIKFTKQSIPSNESFECDSTFSEGSSLADSTVIMKPLSDVFSEINYTAGNLKFGDITEDDEVYIVQSHNLIDVKNLEGRELTLEYSSIIDAGENMKYDCFVNKKTQSFAYIALPNVNNKRMEIGACPVAGSIFLNPTYDTTFSINDSNESENEKSTTEIMAPPLSFLSLKNKKKKKNSDEPEIKKVPVDDPVIEASPKKKKKKHRIDAYSEAETESNSSEFVVEPVTEHISSKNKKIKQKNKDYVPEIKNSLPEPAIESETEATSSKKKKRKTHSSDDGNQTHPESTECLDPVFLDVLNRTAEKELKNKESSSTKSKKRKRKEIDATEYPSSIENEGISPKKKKKKHSRDLSANESELETAIKTEVFSSPGSQINISETSLHIKSERFSSPISSGPMEYIQNEEVIQKKKKKKNRHVDE